MKRKHSSSFERRVIEPAITPKRLAYHKWLDFGTTEIEWSMWETLYMDTVEKRRARGALQLPNEEAETLVAMLETVAYNIAYNDTYIGGVELQILTHSMISYRFTATHGGNWGVCFWQSIGEIMEKAGKKGRDEDQNNKFVNILRHVRMRVINLHSPVIDGEFLCYPIGSVMGISPPVDY